MPCKGGFWADAVSTDMAHKVIISATRRMLFSFIKNLSYVSKNLAVNALNIFPLYIFGV
jgi:hypothetical protein